MTAASSEQQVQGTAPASADGARKAPLADHLADALGRVRQHLQRATMDAEDRLRVSTELRSALDIIDQRLVAERSEAFSAIRDDIGEAIVRATADLGDSDGAIALVADDYLRHAVERGLLRAHGLTRPSAGPTPAIHERRSSPRAFLQAEITFESDSNFFTGFAEDISDGGLFLSTYDLKPVGTLVEVEFCLPTGHLVRAVGEVRWLRDPREEVAGIPPGMGLSFHDLHPVDRQAIAEFIAARAPLFYDD